LKLFRRIENWVLEKLQKRCDHSGVVAADILMNDYEKENIHIQWCIRCGAYRRVEWSGMRVSTVWEWNTPYATEENEKIKNAIPASKGWGNTEVEYVDPILIDPNKLPKNFPYSKKPEKLFPAQNYRRLSVGELQELKEIGKHLTPEQIKSIDRQMREDIRTAEKALNEDPVFGFGVRPSIPGKFEEFPPTPVGYWKGEGGYIDEKGVDHFDVLIPVPDEKNPGAIKNFKTVRVEYNTFRNGRIQPNPTAQDYIEKPSEFPTPKETKSCCTSHNGRRWMLEVGVEGDLFNLHLEDLFISSDLQGMNCKNAGCVPLGTLTPAGWYRIDARIEADIKRRTGCERPKK
jgi:hypothetical protein